MNLFVIGWNMPKKRHSVFLAELQQMTEVYPLLDPETLWHSSSSCGTMFTASMHTADQMAAPRLYVAQGEYHVLFYSGLPINRNGAYHAYHAEALSAHWDQLTEDLEGQYCIVRATENPPSIELLTDFLGMEQVFYLHENDSWIVSNSVHLIERISKPRSLDSTGVSLFLNTGQVAGDRTLRNGIRVIPGGQDWKWGKRDIEPRRQWYYPPSKLACQPHQALTPSYIKRMAEELMQLCCGLNQSFGEIKCTLTGGRDSRLAAALLIGADVPAHYYIWGNPPRADLEIGRLIAETCALSYEFIPITTSDVIGYWDKGCWEVIRQNDGMRSLALMPGVMLANLAPHGEGSNVNLWGNRLNVSFWGNGGEIARGFHPGTGIYVFPRRKGSNIFPHLFLGKHSIERIDSLISESRISNNYGGLIRNDGAALARDYLHNLVMQYVDDGFDPLDIPSVFYAYQRVGRRGGINARGLMPIRDVFSPCCTRSFVEAAFAMPALQRYTEPLHYNLIRLLAPELHRLPFDKSPWRLQQPAMNLLYSFFGSVLNHVWYSRLGRVSHRIIDTFRLQKPEKLYKNPSLYDRSILFEAKREQVREVCMDQNNSLLWHFVDRSMFERITSSVTDPQDRSRYMTALYNIATLFYYDADGRRYAAPDST